MGLDLAAAVFLCGAKSSGVDFSSTAMLGRQALFPGQKTLDKVISVLGITDEAEGLRKHRGYAEPFFTMLGAKEVVSVDFSDYEGAQYVHDLNQPIPDHLRERADVVFDGGTIEHVFNLPQALKNSMEMVKVGGHFISVNEANNFMGHGFWQLCPELMYRALSPANGFRVETVLLYEVVPGGAWHVALDPQEVRGRGELRNTRPTYILTLAKKLAAVEVFATPPQQSDYVAVWEDTKATHYQVAPPRAGWRRFTIYPAKQAWRRLVSPAAREKVFETIYPMIPAPLQLMASTREIYPSTNFRPISIEDVYRGRWS